MIGPRTSIGARPHLITLLNPSTPASDTDSSYTTAPVPLDPPTMFGRVTPATQRDVERAALGTVTAVATHLVTIPFHPGVTAQTQCVVDGRTFQVLGKADLDERHAELTMLCAEVIA